MDSVSMVGTLRRSSRLQGETAVVENAHNDDDSILEDEDDEDDDTPVHIFEGVEYKTYQEMVNAKRERNQQVLRDSGLLDAIVQRQQHKNKKRKNTPTRRFWNVQVDVIRKRPSQEVMTRRNSSRTWRKTTGTTWGVATIDHQSVDDHLHPSTML